MIVFDVQEVTKTYPGRTQPANDRINLQIQGGEIFGLLGDNGAGKTTLVRQMANLLPGDSGRILLFGQPVQKDPTWASRFVGYMPQDGQTLNNLTVGEAIFFTAHLRGLSRTAARHERERLLKLWGLEEFSQVSNRRLSGGQKRLLQLAVAMAGEPPVLLLDEPTNELDPQRRKKVWDTLRRINQERGVTVIFITHDAIEAEKVIQRVGIMQSGRLAALGRPSELKAAVDQKLRLELFFAPETPPRLPPDWQPHVIDAGRWLVYLDRTDASQALEQLDLERLDDFRFYSATLEDLYLYYATAR